MYSRLTPLDDVKEIDNDKTASTRAVVLVAAGDKKIQVIKVVREIRGPGLKEAMELVESVPQVVLRDLSIKDALRYKDRLEAEGALVEIR